MPPPTTTTSSPEYLSQSRVSLINIFCSLPIAFEVLSTSFRIWIRANQKNGTHLTCNDYIIIFATIVSIGVCVIPLAFGTPSGFGRHMEVLTDEDLTNILKGDYIFSHLYTTAISTTKLSILALCYRIFSTNKVRFLILITFSIICVWILITEIVLGLACQSIEAWWSSPDDQSNQCLDREAISYYTNIMNLSADLWIFAMPIPIISRLSLGKGMKVSVPSKDPS